MKLLRILVVLGIAATLVACATTGGGTKAGARSDAIYWCDCGPECKCNSVATHPGKCSCGKEMAGGHLLLMEGNTALACTCGPTCTCKIDPNDHAKCGCGKPVKRVDLTGTGLHVCNCTGGCSCNTISDKPGNCPCGQAMRQVK